MIVTNITQKNHGLNTHVCHTIHFSPILVIIDHNDTSDDPVDYCDRKAIAITFGSTTGRLIIISIAQLIYIVKRPKGTDVCV